MANNFRGPTSGYDSPEKAQYRYDVWECLLPPVLCDIKYKDACHVLLLPSSNGEEIRTVIALGVPENKIVAIDENPALIAASKWRKEFPAVKFYGCKVGAVSAKLKQAKIKISAANLDLCNNFSQELVNETTSFVCSAAFADVSTLAITIAKGRESTLVNYLLDLAITKKNYTDDKRRDCLIDILSRAMSNRLSSLVGWGSYITNKQPMTWLCLEHINKTAYREKLRPAREAAANILKEIKTLEWHRSLAHRVIHNQRRIGNTLSAAKRAIADGSRTDALYLKVFDESIKSRAYAALDAYALTRHKIGDIGGNNDMGHFDSPDGFSRWVAQDLYDATRLFCKHDYHTDPSEEAYHTNISLCASKCQT